MSRIVFLMLIVSSVVLGVRADDSNTKPVPQYEADIRPILQARCFKCHGPDTQKAALDLSSPDGVRRGGESGEILDAEAPAESTLYEYVHEAYMPPDGEPPLSDAELETVVAWILAGAKMPDGSAGESESLTQHDVLPILLLRCATCHGRQRKESDLDVRSKASLLAGGKSGPAIVPGSPESSRILARIHAQEMPPRRDLASASVKPMTDAEIDVLTRWIAAGAPEEDVHPDVASTDPDPLVSDEDRQFWAFQPPIPPAVPTIRRNGTPLAPVDAFLSEKLRAADIDFAPLADRATLIRRAYFDLIGLPPDPAAVERFVADDAPDAYERLIDELLASPRYGERWGQYWLDLAGYSDSEGIQHADLVRNHAYRYRDYVIRSFNADKPYDRFLMEQLAGDELAPYRDVPITEELHDNLVATGFLRMAPDGSTAPITNFVPDRLEIIDDEIEVFSSAILGLTIKCARCHTHKFDPLPQRDYYRLAAIFKPALDEHDWLIASRQSPPPGVRDRYLPFVTDAEKAAWETGEAKPENQPLIRALWDRGEPSPTYVLVRGNYQTPGLLVGPGVPSVLTDGKTPFQVKPPWPGAETTGRRLALARWVTRPEHPLTARVLVNRVWSLHFGRGIVPTLDNFGKAGARPSHPQLLDWLATQFVADGWSIKSLHRRMMTSHAYRQKSKVDSDTLSRDPENRLWSRMPLRRMEGEVVRDSMLAVAGRLDLTPFGPADPIEARDDGLVSAAPRHGQTATWRRSIYLLKRRTQPVTLLESFDVAAMNPNCSRRTESIVAPQALHLTNNRRVYDLALAMADRVSREAGSDVTAQIRYAFRLALGRPARPDELAHATDSYDELLQIWQAEHPGTRHEIVAGRHLWIRESEPDQVYEDDLISVWSSAQGDNGRRYGLVEFDLSHVPSGNWTRATLELGILNSAEIHQTAYHIPSGIDDLTWQQYQDEKSASASALTGLGRFDLVATPPQVGTYATSAEATPEELNWLQALAAAAEPLALVLIAEEDGAAYRQDWDDGVYSATKNRPPRLVIYDDRPDEALVHQKALANICHALLNSAAFLYID